jgi:hypothetical protein
MERGELILSLRSRYNLAKENNKRLLEWELGKYLQEAGASEG